MKVTNVSSATTLRHSTAAATGDRSTRLAGSRGVRVTDGNTVEVQPVRVINFIGATVVDLDDGEVNVLTGGTGVSLDNDAGATLAYGTVVIVNSAGDLTTTTTAQDTRPVGIIQRSTDDDSSAPAVFSGYVVQVNTTGTVNAGDYHETSTSAGVAQSSGTTRRVGTFGRALEAGPNPAAIIWMPDAITGSGSSSGIAGLIGLTSYTGSGSYTTTTSIADMDATNLAVTFVTPTSGKVLIRLTCQVYNSVANSGSLAWGLRESTTLVAGAFGVETGEGDNNAGAVRLVARTLTIVGLTPGSSHTYKWAAKHFTDSWVHRWDNAADGFGPATMEVHAAP